MHEQGTAVLLGQLHQRHEGPPDALVAGAKNAAIEEGHDRVDDGEARVGSGQGVVEPVGLSGEAPGPNLVVALALPDEDALHVGAELLEAWHDRVGRAILGAEHQRVGGTEAGAVVGKRSSGAEAGAEVEREQRFAQVRVAIHDDQLAERNALRPKPGHGLRNNLTGECDRHGCGVGNSGSGQSDGRMPASLCYERMYTTILRGRMQDQF
jgi:hypothetical protein